MVTNGMGLQESMKILWTGMRFILCGWRLGFQFSLTLQEEELKNILISMYTWKINGLLCGRVRHLINRVVSNENVMQIVNLALSGSN